MLSSGILSSYFKNLKHEDIQDSFDSDSDYIAMYMNEYGHCFMESFEGDIDNNDIIYGGGVVADKDDVKRLANEVDFDIESIIYHENI